MGTLGGKSAKLFDDGIKRWFVGPTHNAERQVELGADIGGFVASQGECHQSLGIDAGLGVPEALVEFISCLVKFSGDGFRERNIEGDHRIMGWRLW